MASGFVPNSFKANFKEERVKVLTQKKVYSYGTIEYKYPSQLRFEEEKPNKTILVINPNKTWYYNPPFLDGEKGELQITSTKKNSLGKVFDLLKGGLETNKNYTVEKKNNYYEIQFNKKNQKDIGVIKINLHFNGKMIFGNLNKIKIFYGKKIKTYYFEEIKEGIHLVKNRFNFSVPANTNVNKL